MCRYIIIMHHTTMVCINKPRDIELWFFHVQLSKPVKLLEAPCEQHHTVQFTSDGMYIYWVYVLRQQETFTHPVSGERVKEHPVYLHTLELKVKGATVVFKAVCVEGYTIFH